MNEPLRFPAFPLRLAVVVLVGMALGPRGFGLLQSPVAGPLAVALAASLAALGAMAGLELAALPWRSRAVVLASIVASALMTVWLGPVGLSVTASALMTMVGICLAIMTAAAAGLLVATSSGDGDEWVFLVGSVLMLGGLAIYLASSALCLGLMAGVLWSVAGPRAPVRSSPAGDDLLRILPQLHLRAEIIGLGVDRLDYAKGIPERLEALDRLFSGRPGLRGRLTFVQIAVPSRGDPRSYNAITLEIEERVATLNRKYGRPDEPPPVLYVKSTLGLQNLVALYRRANFCVVSSLHDGMNLVAKEFVAARDDEDGVLVLSALAGAAHELRDALIINPYDIEDFADTLGKALDMRREERRRRMRDMRRIVAGRNVFSWASDILEELESVWTRPLHTAARIPEDSPV